MSYVAAMVYWIIVALWAMVLTSVVYFFVRNPRAFGTTRLLLVVIGIDTFRNIFENAYFGLYFGGQYGVFPSWIVDTLGQPLLLIIPKLMNVVAGCVVLGLLLYRWLPLAVHEWDRSEQRAEDLRTLASIDPLTGLYNRRQFESLARAELGRCQRYMRPLAVLILDVDHFSAVNDRYGHEIGDWALKMLSNAITSAKRDSDIAARIGGEEFALLLPETNKEAARELAERLCQLVRTTPLSLAGHTITLTVSIGVAEASARTSGIESMLRAAEQGLHRAKQAGRDRAMFAVSPTERFSVAAE